MDTNEAGLDPVSSQPLPVFNGKFCTTMMGPTSHERYRLDRGPSVGVRGALHAFALVLGLGCAMSAFALSTDRDQPIDIEADQAEADDLRRVTIYRGDVVINQGTLRITGETVTIHYDQSNELTKLVSVGRPAGFRQRPDGETEYRTARANRLEYYAGEDLIFLLGEAQYGKGDTQVNADKIVYDSLRSRMKAETNKVAVEESSTAPKTTKSRVKIKIVPKKKP